MGGEGGGPSQPAPLPEIPPALEYSSVCVRGTCPMPGGVLMLACLVIAPVSQRTAGPA